MLFDASHPASYIDSIQFSQLLRLSTVFSQMTRLSITMHLTCLPSSWTVVALLLLLAELWPHPIYFPYICSHLFSPDQSKDRIQLVFSIQSIVFTYMLCNFHQLEQLSTPRHIFQPHLFQHSKVNITFDSLSSYSIPTKCSFLQYFHIQQQEMLHLSFLQFPSIHVETQIILPSDAMIYLHF